MKNLANLILGYLEVNSQLNKFQTMKNIIKSIIDIGPTNWRAFEIPSICSFVCFSVYLFIHLGTAQRIFLYEGRVSYNLKSAKAGLSKKDLVLGCLGKRDPKWSVLRLMKSWLVKFLYDVTAVYSFEIDLNDFFQKKILRPKQVKFSPKLDFQVLWKN